MTSFKYKYKKLAKPKLIHVRIENSWYGSSFIWTSTDTDGSQNYLEHCRRCGELPWFYQLSVPAELDNSRELLDEMSVSAVPGGWGCRGYK